MALTKRTVDKIIKKNDFQNSMKAELIFTDFTKDEDERIEALEYLIESQTITCILRLINQTFTENIIKNHIYIDIAFNSFNNKKKVDGDYDNLMVSLQSNNVYLRNMAIKYLQESDEEATIFIEKLLKSSDKDIRIFAINILGDVKYEKSVDMLRYFLAHEDDINAMMTAVDYLGEIGSEDDIPLLETLKITHKDNYYVVFGVDTAISRIKD